MGAWMPLVALGLLCTVHAVLVLRARRPGDPPAVERLVAASLGAATFVVAGAAAAAVGLVDDPGPGFLVVLALFALLAVAATAAQVVLRRRLRRPRPAPDR